MIRQVYCIKQKKHGQGLSMPPLPGERGKWVYENVSQEAWSNWQAHQTRLINEKHLNLLEPKTRAYLLEQMTKYFLGEEIDQAAGYIEPDTKKTNG